MDKGKISAYFAVVLKALIYGSTIFFTGRLLETTDVFDVLALRFLISGGLFGLLRGLGLIKIQLHGKPMELLWLASCFEPVMYFLFETMGIEQTSTITAGVMSAFMPVFTVFFGTVFLKERLNHKGKLFLTLRILGVAAIVLFEQSSGGDSSVAGILFMLLSGLSGVFFLISSRKASGRFSAMEITYFMNMVGMVVFNGINVVRHLISGNLTEYFAPMSHMENVIGLIFLGVCSSVLATLMNNYALGKLPVALVSSFGGLTTVTTIALGVLFNNEKLYGYHIVGTALILIGIIGMSYEQSLKQNGETDE